MIVDNKKLCYLSKNQTKYNIRPRKIYSWINDDSVNIYSTEEYNGTAWSAGGNTLSNPRYTGGCGTQAAGLMMGGEVAGGSTAVTITEEYISPGTGNYDELFIASEGL